MQLTASSTRNDVSPTSRNMNRSPRHTGAFWTFLALLALLVPAADLAAQARTTTGHIRGRVVTPTEQPVANAQVTATSVETGLTRSVLTDANGRYIVRLLPPGTYNVEVESIGFAPALVERVKVAVGETSNANISLQEQAVELEGIDVVADRRPIDVSDASVSQLITAQEIEELPSLGRNFVDFINLSGLVAPDPGETTGGQFSIAGQRASQTNIQIDGVDANNTFFGENRGGSRIPFVFSLESIEEFQVVTNGYDVEYGNYAGGIVNVVTRGGTNEWEGTAYANFRGDQFTSAGFNGEPVEDYSVFQFAGRLSGPIVRDKAHFLVSLDGQRRREPQTPISRELFGPDGETPDPVLFEQVGEFFDVLENQYGIENPSAGYGQFSTSEDVITLFGRIDWNLNENHRLSLRHNYANFTNDSEFSPGFDFIYGQSRAEVYEDVSNSFVGELQSVLGPETFNVFRFQIADEDRPRVGRELRPALIVNLEGGQQIGYGGTFAAFNNNLEETKFQVIDNLTHVIGDHTIKVGGNAIFTQIFNEFLLEGAGEYFFAGLDDFRNFRPSSFERNIQQGGGIPTSEFWVGEWGVFLQDEWLVTPKLTATMGLRYDVQTFFDAPGRVVDIERAFGVPTGVAPSDADNISPRLSLAYDVYGNGDAVLRAGAGYFYGRVPYVLGGNVASTERPQLSLFCGGDVAEGDPDAPPSPEDYAQWNPLGLDSPISCRGAAGVGGVPSYTVWNEGFEFPEIFKTNLGFERRFGSSTLVSVDALYSRSTNLYTVRDANLRDEQFQLASEGGRRVYKPASQFVPTNGASPLPSRRNLDFGPVYINYNDGVSDAFAVTLEGTQRFGGEEWVRGSYTYTTAHDNSSYSCCTAGGGFEDPTVGVFGPNQIGSFGDEDKAWGSSDFVRNHTFVLSGKVVAPLGIQTIATWRLQSGRPWTPEMQGDVNGDGVNFNDRPYIFAPDELPLSVTGAAAEEQRALYASYLANDACVGDYVGQIVPRNTCRMPWYNQLDLRLARSIETQSDQRVELQVDLFNLLNGLNDDWGKFEGVFGSRRNLLLPRRYDAETGRIEYEVANNFGETTTIGSNLLLQFQAQFGVKYYF